LYYRTSRDPQNVACPNRFTRYEHNTGEVEDIIIGRLAVILKLMCQNLQR